MAENEENQENQETKTNKEPQEKRKRNIYALVDTNNKDTGHFYSGRTPRQAACKAACRGTTDVRLRERGRKYKDGKMHIHVFEGSVGKTTVEKDHPANFAGTGTLKYGIVKKVSVERADRQTREVSK